MSLFGNIVDKIVSYAESAAGVASAKATPPSAAGQSPTLAPADTQSAGSPAAPSPEASSTAATPLRSVDIGAVLTARAAAKGETLHWRTSIVDLLKVLDLDSSLDARKQLATELGVHAGADGTAEENVALQKAVVAKLEENGGHVPADMKS